METFAAYLLKSVAWLTGFTFVYILFLRNERFFFLKRYYLIAGILASFIFPLITVHYQVTLPAQTMALADPLTGNQSINTGIQPAIRDKPFDASYIVLSLYLAGIVLLIIKSAKQIKSLISTIQHSDIKDLKQAKVIRASGFKGSFSFFNYIFINPSINENDLEMIMNHELVHVSQKHWLDLLLAEIVRLLQWVNPFAWIYSGLIRQNHEYIADAEALQQTSDPAIYKAVLVNQLFDSMVFCLADSFNYSINKKRFDMMKKIVTSPIRKLKLLLVLPVFAIILYAFAIPDYHYTVASDNKTNAAAIYSPPVILQKEVKGAVTDENGKPLKGVDITSTGIAGSAFWTSTDPQGKFSFSNLPPDASLLFFLRGYKKISLKPDFNSEMKIKMEKDPDYKPQTAIADTKQSVYQQPNPLVAVDGVLTDKNIGDVIKELGYNLGPIKMLSGKDAYDKYGEKADNGVYEITTRKKAIEMGLKPAFPRLSPEDYPTFQGHPWYSFNEWVSGQVSYPAVAQEKKVDGWVTINFNVGLDGTLSNIVSGSSVHQSLIDEVIRAIKSAPNWDPPKNSAVNEPFSSSVTVGFRLPDQIVKEEPFVVVEEMPQYPGGDQALLDFIKSNTQYPEAARLRKLEGKVILRFLVNTDGNTEAISVLKGVDPVLDAEAINVVSMLTGFKPGMQSGRPVNVWYMVPVNFSMKSDTVK